MNRVKPAVRTSTRSRAAADQQSVRRQLSSVGNARVESSLKSRQSINAPSIKPVIEKPAIKRVEKPVEQWKNIETPIGTPSNPLEVSEYEHIIYRTMMTNECKEPAMKLVDGEVNGSLRANAIDALSHVHYRLGCTTNGLYRAIGILDRYLSKKALPKRQLKLYACTAVYVASKIEDVRPCRPRHVIDLGDHCFGPERRFTSRELYAAESDLMTTIDFACTFATPLFFLTQLMRVSGQNQELLLFARYVLEVMQVCEEFGGMKASEQACVAVMASRAVRKQALWNETLAGYTGYKETQLTAWLEKVRDVFGDESRNEFNFTRRKYDSDLFLNVASRYVPLLLKE